MTQTSESGTSFQARLSALRQETGASAIPESTIPAQSIPPKEKKGSGLDDGAKAELRQLPLLPIYRRWFDPQSERVGGNDEVNLSCFNTAFHTGGDKNPQFGINTVLNVYKCHACEFSGDIIDLAANYFGYADSDGKCPQFEIDEVVKLAGEELLGMSFRKTAAGWQRIPQWTPLNPGIQQSAAPVNGTASATGAVVQPPGSVPTETYTGSAVTPPVAPSSVVTHAVATAPVSQTPAPIGLGSIAAPRPPSMTPDMSTYQPPVVDISSRIEEEAKAVSEEEAEEFRLSQANFSLDWRSLVPENTPLRRYMTIVSEDDTPEEFHFWNFMSLIGLTLGKKAFIPDVKPVYGNLLSCIIGRTGQGKSRSEGFIAELIKKGAFFNDQDHMTNGIKVISNPGSGEYMIKQFIHEVPDPTKPAVKGKQPMLTNPSVKGLVRWPEMSTMIGKASGKGSIVRQMVIELYDVPTTIGGGSFSNGEYGAENPYGSVATTTQLDAIRNLVSGDDAASGFLNRWIFILGKPKQFQPWGKPIDISPCVADVKTLTNWAESKYRSSQGWHPLDNDAAERATRFLLDTVEPLQHESNMLARSVLLFKKLMLLFSANMLEEKVSVAAVQQAEIAFRYLIDCLRHIGIRISTSEYESLESAVREFIIEGGPTGITARDLRRKLKRRDASWTTEVVNRHLDTMEKAGVCELRMIGQPPGKPGRPMKRWMLTEED